MRPIRRRGRATVTGGLRPARVFRFAEAVLTARGITIRATAGAGRADVALARAMALARSARWHGPVSLYLHAGVYHCPVTGAYRQHHYRTRTVAHYV